MYRVEHFHIFYQNLIFKNTKNTYITKTAGSYKLYIITRT